MGKSGIEVIARGLVRRGDLILVCRDLAGGYCYLPGGHVEPMESAAEALEREFAEETGLRVKLGLLVAVFELRFSQRGHDRHEVNLVFHVAHLSDGDGGIASREPDIAFEWIAVSDLARARFQPASIRAWLQQGGEATPTVWGSADER